MRREISTLLSVVVLIAAASTAFGAERNKEENKNAEHKSSPGGSWSEPSHHGGQNHEYPNQHGTTGGANENKSGGQNNQGIQHKDAAAADHHDNKEQEQKQQNEKDAAAGAAAANRNSPQYSGAEGAAAGAAAANRNNPQYSGAEGAAAGAAVANRNNPQFSGAQGAAAGAAIANRNQPAVSGAAGAVAGASAVQNSFNNYGMYNSAWFQANPNAWTPGRLAQGSVWSPAPWNSVAAYTGANSAPTWYDYGKNVTCINGVVAVDGSPVGTPEEFSQQASALAESGAAAQAPSSGEWMPLGVFALVRNEQQHPQMIFQMAVNKQGVLRGNYTDEVTENSQPIQGAADPKSQRAAWTVGNNKTTVMEAGLSNLADGDAPVLIHKNGKTDHWLMVRLEQPPQGK